MSTQNLISLLNVTLAADAEVTLPHGLVSAGNPVAPFEITCDRPSTIGVLGADSVSVTFKNHGSAEATAVFRVVREHSVSTDPKDLVAWQGWDGTASPVGPAGGDLFGTYPNPQVVGIWGNPIEDAGPDNGDALIFNSALGMWEHAPIVFGGGPPVGPASGDLGGIYPGPTVVKLNTYPLDLTAPVAGDYLKFDGTVWRHTLVTPGSQTAIYGAFSANVDQNITTSPTVVQFDTVEGANGVTLASGSRLTVTESGVYGVDISPQLAHSGGGTETITFWLRVDGVDVPRSASSLEMGNNNNRTLPFLQIDLPLNAGQYIEWVFVSTTASNLTLEHFPEQTSPPAAFAIPSIPAAIANVKRIGSIA